jgi:hypothetical protein
MKAALNTTPNKGTPTTTKQAQSIGAIVGEDFFSEEQLGLELNVTLRTLRRWQQLRIGPPRTRVGRRVLYRKTAVIQWLVNREQQPLRRRFR